MADIHDKQLYRAGSLEKIFPIVDVEDTLDSTSTTRPLSAYQGKVLKELIDKISSLSLEIVDSLPATGDSTKIYLVKDESSVEEGNSYTEYVWIESSASYEKLGTIGNVVVDSALDTTSENPVQNKVIAEAIAKINEELFPLTVTVSGGGTYEVGTTQDVVVSWTTKQGSDTVTPDSVTINDEAVDASSTSKTFSNVTGTTTYTVKVTKDGTTVSGSVTARFVNASYYGVVDADFEPTEAAITALTKSVKNTKSLSSTFALNNQKVCYAYPTSLGALTSIKDSNNFEYINSYTQTTMTINDVSYYVYVLTDATTIDSFTQTYA